MHSDSRFAELARGRGNFSLLKGGGQDAPTWRTEHPGKVLRKQQRLARGLCGPEWPIQIGAGPGQCDLILRR